METELISVIVPVYNVERYVKKCIESILAQSYQRIEVIIVDDESSDNSASICEKSEKSDARIKLIRNEHVGLSGARNVGLDNAKGQYIIFVDSDDYINQKINHIFIC